MDKKLKPIMMKINEEDKAQREQQIKEGQIFVKIEEKQETKSYLVLFVGTDEEGKDMKSYELIDGENSRIKTFEFIKTIVDSIDIHESKVLSSTVNLDKAISVYQFMKFVADRIEGNSFDIEDYNYGYSEEQ